MPPSVAEDRCSVPHHSPVGWGTAARSPDVALSAGEKAQATALCPGVQVLTGAEQPHVPKHEAGGGLRTGGQAPLPHSHDIQASAHNSPTSPANCDHRRAELSVDSPKRLWSLMRVGLHSLMRALQAAVRPVSCERWFPDMQDLLPQTDFTLLTQHKGHRIQLGIVACFLLDK